MKKTKYTKRNLLWPYLRHPHRIFELLNERDSLREQLELEKHGRSYEEGRADELTNELRARLKAMDEMETQHEQDVDDLLGAVHALKAEAAGLRAEIAWLKADDAVRTKKTSATG